MFKPTQKSSYTIGRVHPTPANNTSGIIFFTATTHTHIRYESIYLKNCPAIEWAHLIHNMSIFEEFLFDFLRIQL